MIKKEIVCVHIHIINRINADIKRNSN